mmetsp:Transcript_21110/g.23655  ORF Transcript_21110/g.23655 Transcript_21110/m.23655 type:complete len:102 (+) Transcript_21110:46-351(+)
MALSFLCEYCTLPLYHETNNMRGVLYYRNELPGDVVLVLLCDMMVVLLSLGTEGVGDETTPNESSVFGVGVVWCVFVEELRNCGCSDFLLTRGCLCWQITV